MIALAVPLLLFTQLLIPFAQEPQVTHAVSEASGPSLTADLTFDFKPRDETQPAWQVSLRVDGKDTYRELSPGAISQPIQSSAAFRKRVAAGLPAVRSGTCETRQKGIAQTGVKTFSVIAGAIAQSCTFNYSDSDSLNDAAAAFQALAETMHEGVRLQHSHRFDRLALDAEMDALVSEVQSGRAVEVANIAPVLQSLVDDERVIDRVRRKAARLLQASAPEASKPL